MAGKAILEQWVEEALRNLGGSASPLQVARQIWNGHAKDLENAGDLFYTWQYDMRWAALRLRNAGVMLPVERSAKGRWQLRY